MSVELSLFDMVQLACADPIPLIVADEQVSIQIKPQTIRGAQTACPRDEFTLHGHLANPTPVGNASIHSLQVASFVEPTPFLKPDVRAA